MIDVFMVLEAVDFGGFWLVEGVTDGQDPTHAFDGLLNGDVVAVKYGKETGFEYFLVLLFVFTGKGL